MTESDSPSENDIAKQIRELHRDVTFEIQKRERPDRHPYQVGVLSGLLIVSFFQVVIGIPPQSALYEVVDRVTLIALNMPFIMGSILALWGAALNRDRHFALSLRLGIAGHLSTFVASSTYSALVIIASSDFGSRPYWLSVTSVGLGLGLAYASAVRFKQMLQLLRQYQRREHDKHAQ